jgi:outer membrane receptor protein involved in Fe transport
MKTIKVLFISLLCSISLTNLLAQQISSPDMSSKIKGVLNDIIDSTPVGFANVALYKQSDSTLVTWTLAKDDGSFELDRIPIGTYKLVTTFLGYEKHSLSNISVGKSGSVVDLGKIKIKSVTTSLGEVQVVGIRKTVDSKIDRKVINVSGDINSTGGTAVDLLKNVPGLTVDGSGTVSLRGNTDVSILIDGRPTSIDATRLDQIPSSDIESVELISNPGAKYNPEGKSGIINLKLKQKKAAGFNGNTSLTVGTGNKYNAGIGFNYNTGIINIFGSYNGMFRKTESQRYLLRESFISDSAHFLQQNADANLSIKSNKFSLGANIKVNEQNSLAVSYTFNPSLKIDADGTLSQYFDKSKNLTESIFTDNSERATANSHDFLLGYRKTFDKKGEDLTADYTYSASNENIDQPQVFHFKDYSQSQEIFNTSKNFKSNFQLNWILPVGSKSKLESGVQSIIRGNKTNYYQNNLVANNWISDVTNSNIFAYNEQIHSAYSTFSGIYDVLSYVAGLRLEQTYINGEQTINSEIIRQKYFNLYPSFSVKYSLNQKNQLQLSYGRRINRPNSRMINPFIDKSNLEVYRSGNPDLRPEYINSIDAGYNGNWSKSNIGLTVFYNDISNLINSVTTLDSAGISHNAPQNISSGKNFGFELTFEHTVTTWWKMNGNGSFYKNTIISEKEGISNSNYSYNARLNNVFTPFKKTSVQLVGIYTGPIIAISSKMNPQFSVDLAVKRDLLKDKLSLTARVADIFNTLKNSYTTWGSNFFADNWRKTETRVAYVSILYNFGSNGIPRSSKSNGNNESTHSTEIF